MSIPRESIDPDADKVVRRLRRHGHTAYLVGGCVRDLLLGRKPKDFDVATSATPPETKDLFRNCRIIGRRFRLAHIFFGSKIIETSTFRMNPREGVPVEEVEELLIKRDNVFGTAEEDARRRDFTINGLFYDIEAAEVIDYVGGRADLEARLVRTIGDPDIRFREDPVRILRAIKFAARLDFQVEPATYAAMLAHRGEIPKCAPPRVLEEVYRLLRGGAARKSMQLLLETGVAATLAPELAWLFGGDGALLDGPPPSMLPPELFGDSQRAQTVRDRAWRVLDELDAVASGAAGDSILTGTASNALLLCVLTAPFLPDPTPGERESARLPAIDEVLGPLVQRLRASRRDGERARQILLAQRRLEPGRRRRARPMALVRRDYFVEALVLYEILARADGAVGDEIAKWKSMWRGVQREMRHGLSEIARRVAEAGAIDLSVGAPPSPDRSAEPDEAAPEAHGEPRNIWTDDAGAPSEPGARRRRRRRRGGRRRRRSPAVAASAGGENAAAADPLFTDSDPTGE